MHVKTSKERAKIPRHIAMSSTTSIDDDGGKKSRGVITVMDGWQYRKKGMYNMKREYC